MILLILAFRKESARVRSDSGTSDTSQGACISMSFSGGLVCRVLAVGVESDVADCNASAAVKVRAYVINCVSLL